VPYRIFACFVQYFITLGLAYGICFWFADVMNTQSLPNIQAHTTTSVCHCSMTVRTDEMTLYLMLVLPVISRQSASHWPVPVPSCPVGGVVISAFSMLWTILGLLCFLLPTAVIGMITILWPVKFSRRAQTRK